MNNQEIAILLVRYMAATGGDLPDELKRLMTRDVADMMVYLAWKHAQAGPAEPA